MSRNGHLPDGWKYRRLGEICQINPPRNAEVRARKPDQSTSFLPMANIDGKLGRIGKLETRSYEELRSGYTYFEENDFLFAKITPCMQNGKHALARNLIDGIGFGSTEFHVIRPSAEATPEYIDHFLKQPSVIRAAEQSLTGSSGQKRVPEDFLADLHIPVPPLHQQRKIVEILGSVNENIEKTKTLITKLQDLKRGMMQELLTNGIGHTEFEESPVGKIPAGWGVCRLGDVAHVIDCVHKTAAYQPSGIPILHPRNVRSDGLDLSDIDYVSQEDFDILTSRHVPRRGDIIFLRSVSSGIVCYVDVDRQFCIGHDLVIITRLEADTRFLFYALSSEPVASQIARNSSGSTFERIGLADIRNLLVPVPSIAEQHKIASILDATDRRISTKKMHACKLMDMRTALAQDLFAGKVRVEE